MAGGGCARNSRSEFRSAAASLFMSRARQPAGTSLIDVERTPARAITCPLNTSPENVARSVAPQTHEDRVIENCASPLPRSGGPCSRGRNEPHAPWLRVVRKGEQSPSRSHGSGGGGGDGGGGGGGGGGGSGSGGAGGGDGVRSSGGAATGDGRGASTPKEASAGSRVGAGAGAGVGVGAVTVAGSGGIVAEIGGAVEAGAVGGCGTAMRGWSCGGDDCGWVGDPGVMRFVRLRLPSCASVSCASVAAVAGCEASCRRRSTTCQGAARRVSVMRHMEACEA